jgi:hypothetical protein
LIEPNIKRTYAYFDGQNFFYAAREAFGYRYPNYAPWILSTKICQMYGWHLDKIFFYTGIPSPQDDPFWSGFWAKKLAIMGTRGVEVFSRELRYRNRSIRLEDGSEKTILVGQEKGIDIRLALDVIRCGWDELFDVALIFSQDQDLSEVAVEIRRIAARQKRWIKIASAFPLSPASVNKRGIHRTDWIKIDKALYDSCVDPADYRPE